MMGTCVAVVGMLMAIWYAKGVAKKVLEEANKEDGDAEDGGAGVVGDGKLLISMSLDQGTGAHGKQGGMKQGGMVMGIGRSIFRPVLVRSALQVVVVVDDGASKSEVCSIIIIIIIIIIWIMVIITAFAFRV